MSSANMIGFSTFMKRDVNHLHIIDNRNNKSLKMDPRVTPRVTVAQCIKCARIPVFTDPYSLV